MLKIFESIINWGSTVNWFSTWEWYYWLSIGAAFVLMLLIGLIFKYREFRKVALDLVVIAEGLITGTKKGQERFDYVVSKIYDYIPTSLRLLLTKRRIKNIIEWAVRKMKKYLAKGIDYDVIVYDSDNKVKDVINISKGSLSKPSDGSSDSK